MKTKIILTLTLALGLNAIIGAESNLSYVITSDDTIICKHISIGVNNARITKLNDEFVKVDKEYLKAFSLHGKLFEKLPVYLNGNFTGQTAFLELVGQRNGLKLYKYTYFEDSTWSSDNKSVQAAHEVTALFVYKDKDYYLQVNNKNAKTVLPFFHIDGV